MSDFAIVAATVRSVDHIMPVMASAFDPRYGEAWTAAQCAGMLSLPGSWLLVAQGSLHVAGFALTRVIADEAELLLLAVDTGHQRRKIGASLLDRVISDAAAKGASTLFVEVRANNPAQYFYQQRGFSAVGHRKDYYRGIDGQLTDAVTFNHIIG